MFFFSITVSRYRNSSVFKTEIQLEDSHRPRHLNLELNSASTSEWFNTIIVEQDISGLQDTFVGQSCTFEIQKEVAESIVTYSIRELERDKCRSSENAKEYIEVLTTFKVGLKNPKRDPSIYYIRHGADILKEYVNRTWTRLTFNEETMQRDGFEIFESYYEVEAYNLAKFANDTDIIFYNTWKINLM